MATKTTFDFNGRRIVVTGAGRGIGWDIVKTLVASNAKVVAVSRTKANLDKLKQEFPDVETVCVDFSDSKATKAAAESIQGPIDGLVNNAGVAIMTPVLDKDLDIGACDKQFSVNVTAPMIFAQVVARNIINRKAKGGAIVNISSLASLVALKDHMAYAASKAALDMATKVLALELGPHGIRVNSVNPTVVTTEMAMVGWSDPVKAEAMKSRIPLHKFCEPSDVSNLVLYLLSDQSDMVNGAIIPLDGGASA